MQIGCLAFFIICVVIAIGQVLLASLNMEKEFYILAGIFVIISVAIKYLFYKFGAPKLETYFRGAIGIAILFFLFGFLTQPALDHEAKEAKEKAIRAEEKAKKDAAEKAEAEKRETVAKEEQAKADEERMSQERERQKNASPIIREWCQNVRAKIADVDEQTNYHYARIKSGSFDAGMDSAHALEHNMEMYWKEFMTNNMYAIPKVGSSKQQELMKEIKNEVSQCISSRRHAAEKWVKVFDGENISVSKINNDINVSDANLLQAVVNLQELESTL